MVLNAIDVMGFAGGFTLGMVQAGFNLVDKCELSGGFGVTSCEANRHLLGHAWSAQVGPAESWSVTPNAQVVFGNPPCSAWSVMARNVFRGANSPALACTRAFVHHVVRVKPQVAVFESVQQAFTHPDGLTLLRALHEYVEEHTGERWTLYHVRHNAYSVGGAAQRKRYFWLISRVPFGVEIPQISHQPTLNDVIGDLANLDITWNVQPYRTEPHEWALTLRSHLGATDGHMWLHQRPLTKRVLDLMSGVEWNPGDDFNQVTRRYYERHGRLPESFRETQDRIIRRNFHTGFTTPVRWDGERHARVIIGGALQLVIHPQLNRLITHREAARVMGFPDDWLIAPLQHVSNLPATWGKGVTVQCGRWIGEWIHAALRGEPGSHVGTRVGEREYDINITHTWRTTAPTRRPSKISPNTRDRITSYDRVKIVATPNLTQMKGYDTMTIENASRRGRPRSQDTIARDEQIFDALEMPKTRTELVTELGLESSKVFLSLFRLRNADRITRRRDGSRHLWVRATDSGLNDDNDDTHGDDDDDDDDSVAVFTDSDDLNV